MGLPTAATAGPRSSAHPVGDVRRRSQRRMAAGEKVTMRPSFSRTAAQLHRRGQGTAGPRIQPHGRAWRRSVALHQRLAHGGEFAGRRPLALAAGHRREGAAWRGPRRRRRAEAGDGVPRSGSANMGGCAGKGAITAGSSSRSSVSSSPRSSGRGMGSGTVPESRAPPARRRLRRGLRRTRPQPAQTTAAPAAAPIAAHSPRANAKDGDARKGEARAKETRRMWEHVGRDTKGRSPPTEPPPRYR